MKGESGTLMCGPGSLSWVRRCSVWVAILLVGFWAMESCKSSIYFSAGFFCDEFRFAFSLGDCFDNWKYWSWYGELSSLARDGVWKSASLALIGCSPAADEPTSGKEEAMSRGVVKSWVVWYRPLLVKSLSLTFWIAAWKASVPASPFGLL